jgi:hypothetical protein
MQTLAVLNPLASIDQHLMDDADLAGPVLFVLLFGTFLLLSGKVSFGYVYGVALMGCISIHILLSLMSPPILQNDERPSHFQSSLTFPRSSSVLGYCLLPLVLVSLLGITLPLDTALGYLLTSLAIIWSTYSSSGMFCAVGRMRSVRGLVAYPLFLFYGCFGLMSIFSSKGTGALAKQAGVH